MQYPVVRRKDDVWTVELDNVANPPATPIEAREQVTEGGTARVFMPVKDPGLKIDLKDPVVGDRLVVVPVFGSGFGFDQSRQYAEFRLLGTPQGIAIEPRADWLTVQRESNGIAITGARALAHSADTPGDKKSVSDRPALNSPTRLIDFDAWRRGSDDDYWDNLDKLLYDLSLAPSDARNAARWSLAKFYLAHHMAADALGVLGLMAKSDVRLEEDKQFRAVRGVANIFMGRYADALEDLSYPRLDAEPDAALWRAVAEAKLGKNEAALDHYHQGLDVITHYGEIDRARFQLAAATAAMGVGDVDTMNTETSVLDGMKLPVSMEAQAKYLEGRMYELQNDATSALDAYAKAIDMHYRPVAAKAEFRQIEVEAKEGKIKPKEEIDKLDALRFKWRGGPLEFDVLHKLGQRYVDEGDYRHGLEILRQAVTYFPDSDATRAITQEMNQIFRKLFLDGGADKMAPVAAVALYYDFQELTPIGSDGDEMVRKLSDRLVKVDLLDRAEQLLEHQVNYRLKGAAQAQVAARLARVYLLDRKPEKAVKIIEDTRQVLLPPQIGHIRLMLEAKGLADMKKYDEAEGTLEGINGRPADLVRADIYWDSQQWNKVVSISNEDPRRPLGEGRGVGADRAPDGHALGGGARARERPAGPRRRSEEIRQADGGDARRQRLRGGHDHRRSDRHQSARSREPDRQRQHDRETVRRLRRSDRPGVLTSFRFGSRAPLMLRSPSDITTTGGSHGRRRTEHRSEGAVSADHDRGAAVLLVRLRPQQQPALLRRFPQRHVIHPGGLHPEESRRRLALRLQAHQEPAVLRRVAQ